MNITLVKELMECIKVDDFDGASLVLNRMRDASTKRNDTIIVTNTFSLVNVYIGKGELTFGKQYKATHHDLNYIYVCLNGVSLSFPYEDFIPANLYRKVISKVSNEFLVEGNEYTIFRSFGDTMDNVRFIDKGNVVRSVSYSNCFK